MSLSTTMPTTEGKDPAHYAPAQHASATATGRDRALDLVRCGCLLVVVILHAMMSGAELGPRGEVVPVVALSTSTGFAFGSWFFQVMPLFFFIGGFAALSQWRRTQAKGENWADYLRVRIRRLIAPVAVLICVAGLGIAVASAAGVSAELLSEASRRIGQPLWFLAVYVGLTSLVPVAARFHDRAPRRSIWALAGAVIVVDVLVRVTEVTGLGYLNFLFVWPLVQQCGFFYVDMVGRPVRRGLVWVILVSALLSLGVLVSLGVYSPNMLVNLNPPTGALVLLGLAQICALRLGHGWLNSKIANSRTRMDGSLAQDGTLRRRKGWAWDDVIDWGNKYGMHVYLWHMPIVIMLIGVMGFTASLSLGGFVLPEIESFAWWLSRGPWLLAVLGLAALVAVAMSKVDCPRNEVLVQEGSSIGRRLDLAARIPISQTARISQRGRAGLAIGLAIAGIAIALIVGIFPLLWTIVSMTALLASMMLAAGLGSRAVRDPHCAPRKKR